MTMRATFAVITALGLAFAAPAKADWQYTRWGMSPQEVVAASKGASRLDRAPPGHEVFDASLGASGGYETQGYTFRSEFYFDGAQRLKGIRLMLTDFSKCDSLLDLLLGLYGSSGGIDKFGASWVDVSNGNKVRLTKMGGIGTSAPTCFVAYSPLSGSGALGL